MIPPGLANAGPLDQNALRGWCQIMGKTPGCCVSRIGSASGGPDLCRIRNYSAGQPASSIL